MYVIYVDDEKPALDNFRLTVQNFPEIKSLQLFRNGEQALEWAKENPVDTAFLDMEMQPIHGIDLARKLRQIHPHARIIFVTAYERYALDAFKADAIGYLLKPYSRQDVRKELKKAACFQPLPEKKVSIRTIPDFIVFANGKRLLLGRTKPEELLALLVDRGQAGITSGEAIACLWPGRVADGSSQSLYRMTFKRLMDVLKEEGIDDIILSEGRKKYILTEKVDCDLYQILAGDLDAGKQYYGEYMREYSWAEERNAQINRILHRM